MIFAQRYVIICQYCRIFLQMDKQTMRTKYLTPLFRCKPKITINQDLNLQKIIPICQIWCISLSISIKLMQMETKYKDAYVRSGIFVIILTLPPLSFATGYYIIINCMRKENYSYSSRQTPAFIGFGQKSGRKQKSHRKSPRSEWNDQQRFFQSNGWNCKTEIKVVRDVKNQNGEYPGCQIRSARTIRYRVKDEETDIFISDMHLGLKIQNYIQKELYSIFSQPQTSQPPPLRYFSYMEVRCRTCNEIGHTPAECSTSSRYPITNPHEKCLFCEKYGHHIKDCSMIKENLMRKSGNQEKYQCKEGLMSPNELSYTACDIDY